MYRDIFYGALVALVIIAIMVSVHLIIVSNYP